ncbi:Shedu anti-phage system protein SduA domain-containing protein [Streptomyces sp. NPDC054904]
MDNPQSSPRALQGTVDPDADPTRPKALDWITYTERVVADWRGLLAQDPEEDAVQSFLELHPAMVPGGSGDVGPGGHHGSDMEAVFRRPKLIGGGRTFEPDFMWVTRSSGLVTPILIEIEKPTKRWFRKDGRPTGEFTEARDQLNDWRSWFAREGNQAHFRDTFLFLCDKYRDRPLEPQFLLIYGRESEFEIGGRHMNPEELRYKRDQQRARDESFMTFDALRPRYDHGNSMTLTMTAHGPEVHAFSPVYGTSAFVGEGALVLGDPVPALSRSAMMSDERRAYLAQRWAHWQEDERKKNATPNAMYWRRSGVE